MRLCAIENGLIISAMALSTAFIKGSWASIGAFDENVTYYQSVNANSWQGVVWSDVLSYIDALIDVDFSSSTRLSSDMSISHKALNYGTLGLTTLDEIGVVTTYADIELDNIQITQTAVQSGLDLESYYRYVAAHELGHALGLKHPFDDYPSSLSATADDTVMAYDDGGYFTRLDVAALIEKNGIENDTLNGEMPVYRFYNTKNGGHFFTASAEEATLVATTMYDVFHYEGTAFYASLNSANSTNDTAIYRFYNQINGGHFFTAGIDERDFVINNYAGTYIYEGIGFYASSDDDNLSDIVYRFYNQNTGGHFFTSSDAELQVALNISGFIYEGIGFYA